MDSCSRKKDGNTGCSPHLWLRRCERVNYLEREPFRRTEVVTVGKLKNEKAAAKEVTREMIKGCSELDLESV